jgi:hypothetical protein
VNLFQKVALYLGVGFVVLVLPGLGILIFTPLAWRRGWKWRALLPTALGITAAAIVGLTNVASTQGFSVLVAGALVAMTLNPYEAKVSKSEQDAKQAEAEQEVERISSSQGEARP